MLYYSLKTNSTRTGYIEITTTRPVPGAKPQESDPFALKEQRQLSVVGSDSYKRSLRRAFTRAKYLAFFNPDLNTFITLTYKANEQSPTKVIKDMKNLVLQHKKHHKKPFKYIYVMEVQKRGAIHVHMICNDVLDYVVNKNSYRSVKYWKHGYSSVLTIQDLDNNFKPYLYLFKYMQKAQRVGKSFLHISRNFDKILPVHYDEFINVLIEGNLAYTEDFEFIHEGKNHTVIKNYYQQTGAPISAQKENV